MKSKNSNELDLFYSKLFDNSIEDGIKQKHLKIYDYFKKLNEIEKKILDSTIQQKLYEEEYSIDNDIDCIRFLEVEWADIIFVVEKNFKSIVEKIFEEVYCLEKGISIKDYRKKILQKNAISDIERLSLILQGESTTIKNDSDSNHYHFSGIEENEDYKVNIHDFLNQLLIELKLFHNILIVIQDFDFSKKLPSILNKQIDNSFSINNNEQTLIITNVYYNPEEPKEVNPIKLIELSRKIRSLNYFFSENNHAKKNIFDKSTSRILNDFNTESFY